MGSSHSAEVPGGGSEGYHVLRVGDTTYFELPVLCFSVASNTSMFYFPGAGWVSRAEGQLRGIF